MDFSYLLKTQLLHIHEAELSGKEISLADIRNGVKIEIWHSAHLCCEYWNVVKPESAKVER